jgi:hypothetical protein
VLFCNKIPESGYFRKKVNNVEAESPDSFRFRKSVTSPQLHGPTVCQTQRERDMSGAAVTERHENVCVFSLGTGVGRRGEVGAGHRGFLRKKKEERERKKRIKLHFSQVALSSTSLSTVNPF